MGTHTISLPQKKNIAGFFQFLPILALCIDLFTPFPIWKNILPPAIRWGSHAAVALMIVVTLLRMLSFNHIPRSFWFIVAVSMVWSFVAIGNGQGILPTVWGVWLLFQFPFVYLFAYLQPTWPQKIPEYLRKFGLWILGLQVFVQLLQYAAGEAPGDQLAGLFGRNGTGNAVIFAILISCLYLGYWITSKQWFGVTISLVFGAISSALGEMKLFPIAILIIGIVAVLIYAIKKRSLINFFVYTSLIFTVSIGFAYLYNFVVPGAEKRPLQNYFTNPNSRNEYLNRSESYYNSEGYTYTDIGRNYAVKIGWNALQKDPTTLFFGYGIGTRSESRTLGTEGVALTTGGLGRSVGTSLLVMMQEMGLIGFVILSGLIIWIILSLTRDIRKKPSSKAVELRYALLSFSILWPVFLWYANVWAMRVPMFLYWFLLGYVFAESRVSKIEIQKNAPVSLR